MFDSSFDRTLSYRHALAHDCWGNRRALRCGVRNHVWFLDAASFDEPPVIEQPEDPTTGRLSRLDDFAAAACFTPIELATLHALVVERLTLAEIARRDGCSRQAVLARLIGNSRRQGGIVRKARALRARVGLLPRRPLNE
jgi:hypothetical protein